MDKKQKRKVREKMADERVTSIKITAPSGDKSYELDFNRDSVRFAESRGFKMEDVFDYPETKFPELFYYSFRYHHRNLSKQQTDKIYEELNGFSREFLETLVTLYNQAMLANNVVDSTEEMGKNSGWTVEL